MPPLFNFQPQPYALSTLGSTQAGALLPQRSGPQEHRAQALFAALGRLEAGRFVKP